MEINRYVVVLLVILFCAACNNRISNSQKQVKFTCKSIYVDTSMYYYLPILFRVKVSNKSNQNYKFFANISWVDKNEVGSNFFIQNLIYKTKYQLFLASGPLLNYLYSGHSYEIPLVMGKELSWHRLKKMSADVKNNKVANLDSLLVDKFLRNSSLFFVSDTMDFKNHHIDLDYFIKDTIWISYKDSTPVYFANPTVEEYIHDSLFKKEHKPIFFLNK